MPAHHLSAKWRQVKTKRTRKTPATVAPKSVALPETVRQRLEQARREAIDFAALEYLYASVPPLRSVIDAHPPPHFIACDVFTVLVQAIVWQQVSARAAAKLWPRLVEVLETQVPGSIRRSMPHLYVNPGPLASIPDPALLRAAGIPQSRCAAIVEAARAFHAKPDLYHNWNDSIEDDEVVRRLCCLRGVGEWTAHMVLMFAMRRMNVLPVGDLGVRRGFAVVFDLKPDARREQGAAGRRSVLPSPDAVKKFASSAACGNGRFLTVVSYYMWRAAGADVLVPDGTLVPDLASTV
jgi:DNA-3-methyladenine glycosylase II